MTLHIGKLAKMQRELDKRIDNEHPLQGVETVSDRIKMKKVALMVELGELANAWRGFKYWSHDNTPRTDMIDEYCDCLHFILSLGEYDEDDCIDSDIRNIIWPATVLYAPHHFKIAHMFEHLFQMLIDPQGRRNFLLGLINLGHLLGFTDSQIEEAYEAKNRVNHMRQETGY